VHVPSTGWKCCHPDDSVRRGALEAAAAVFAPAAEIGARVVVVHPTSPDAPLTAEEFDANRRRARESLAELAGRAGRLGLLMAAENLPARGKPRPGAIVSEVLELVEGLGGHVGVCLDAGHANANGARAADEVRVAGGKLFAVHIQDNNGEGEDQHLFPGRGTTDWEAFVAALDEIGFENPRVFEVPSRKGGVAETLAGLAELARRWSEPR
jgi:sugar phosphate isomerase/epimerase